MKDYVAPPLPKVDDVVHSTGPFPCRGVVRAILSEPDDMTIIVVRLMTEGRRYIWKCENQFSWQYGTLRPGPVPKKIDGRWPWEYPRTPEGT